MIFHLFVITAVVIITVVDSVRLVKLTPLRCNGKFLPPSESKEVSTAFLSQGKLEVLESDEDDNEAILCDIMPVPLFDVRGEKIVTKLLAQRGFDPFSIHNVFVNRDNGVYDNLPWEWKGKGSRARLELYNLLQQIRIEKRFQDAPELAFFTALNNILDAKVTGLFFEVRDELATNSVSLGAALVVARNGVAKEWKLSRSNSGLPSASSTDADIREHDVCVVNCHPDELVSIALLLNMPIYMPEQLFDSSAIDARLINYEDNNIDGANGEETDKDDEAEGVERQAPSKTGKKGTSMMIYAPVFRSARKRAEWEKRGEQKSAGKSIEREITPAWEIFDPKKIMGMSSIEKRAVLRASGVTSLPRPREGLGSLDRALIDKMDDAVRGEVLRLIAGSGDASLPPQQQPTSARQVKLQEIGQALEDGDVDRAEWLRTEFMTMTERRADPTQEEGSYDRFLDQDEWYLEQRRKAMAPPKKKN